MNPHESRLLGAPRGAGGTEFGYGWHSRTFGLGIVKIELIPDNGPIKSISVIERISTAHPYFRACYATSTTTRWFALTKGEVLEQVHVRLSSAGDAIVAVKFHTDLRRSAWYGSNNGDVQTIIAPHGTGILMVHGQCSAGACKNIGGYFVARELLDDAVSDSVELGVSAPVGERAFDMNSWGYFRCGQDVRAIVFEIHEVLCRIRCIGPEQYERHLASRDTSLGDGECLVVFAKDEKITSVRALFDGSRVTSVQLVTTRQTTEWFGPAPDKDATIITRGIDEMPSATHIDSFRGMRGDLCINSLAVIFCKQKN